jgi:VWFA-related protein
MRKTFAVAALCTALCAALIWAQQPAAKPGAPSQGSTPTFRSTTRLVQVNVIVRHKGEPVTDLKKDDFKVFDNGKQQTISSFSISSSNGKLPTSPIKLPPGVYTNQLMSKPGTPQSVTIILLDMQNTSARAGTAMAQQQWARQQVVKFLQTIHPEDRVGVYLLTGAGLKVLHDYTTDSSGLLRALNAYSDGKTLPDISQDETMSFGTDMVSLNNWVTTGSTGAQRDFYMIDRVKGTLAVIQFIANHLASLPGRKNLVWVSTGFPLLIGYSPEAMRDPSRIQADFSDDISKTVKAVNDANVAIYPVDERGLVTDQRFNAENQKVNLKPKLGMGPIVANQQTMEEMASRTGGKAFYNTNDLKKAIRDAIEDSSTTYTLGFYPSDEEYDGKFHKLSVKVEHAGIGYDVRYRKGYYDFPNKTADDKTRKVEIADAVMSPLDSTALGVSVGTARTDKPAPNTMVVRMEVDPNGIGWSPNADRMHAKLDIFLVQKNDRGNQFGGTDDTIELNLTKPDFDKMMKSQGLLLPDRNVPLVAQASQLRIVVRDDASGTLGSVTVPLKGASATSPQLIKRDPAPAAPSPAAPKKQ